MREPPSHFRDVLDVVLSRRRLLGGGVAGAVAFVSGCAELFPQEPVVVDPNLPTLGFRPVKKSRADELRFAHRDGYRTQVLLPWGTPICGRYPMYRDGGQSSGADQAEQMGMHHDGLHFFPLPTAADGYERGLLAVNHEYIDRSLLLPAPEPGAQRKREAVDKEMAAHGVSIVEIVRTGAEDGEWQMVPKSRFNRRITATTPVQISGPLRGHPMMRTRYSPDGTRGRGTLGNCGNGFTPWGSYLTCEENFQHYFRSDDPARPEHRDYGITGTSDDAGGFRWHTVKGELYERFDASPKGGDPARDYGNEAHQFGWVVEIDPRDPQAEPRKRTAMGRFAHESCAMSRAVAGQPLAFYMGDDAPGEFIYKFVTRRNFDTQSSGGAMLDEGTLYAARFDSNQRGEWLPITPDNPAIAAAGYMTIGEVLVDTRGAARAAGATPMDRPEWTTVNPLTGEVYVSLTCNLTRGESGDMPTDAANPRGPNRYGHIVRLKELGEQAASRRFAWEVYLFGGTPADAQSNRSNLTEDNDFGNPDGLRFDRRGVLWIQTDHCTREVADKIGSNNQMLAAAPLAGGKVDLRRFLVGPKGCEIAGVTFTPDGSTMFVSIQHPGEGTDSHWPDGGDTRPRSAVVAIWHEDGRMVGS